MKEITATSLDELEKYKEAYDAIGVEYDVEYTLQVQASTDTNVIPVSTDTNPEATTDTKSSSSASSTDTQTDGGTSASPAGSTGRNNTVPDESTKEFKVMKALASHDKRYPTIKDLLPDGDKNACNRLSSTLTRLKKKDLIESKKTDRKASNGKRLTGYRIVQKYRRDFAQYDSLNEDALSTT